MEAAIKRHMVRSVLNFAGPTDSGVGWECVDCGRVFDHWPADSEPCTPPQARRHPGVLCDGDRDLIELWRTHGLPRGSDGRLDDSTAEFAARLAVQLLDGLDIAWDVIDSLTRKATP